MRWPIFYVSGILKKKGGGRGEASLETKNLIFF